MGSTGPKTPDWLRVLRSLQAAGGRGICQQDWDQVGHTPDGGGQIRTIERRIYDLKKKGYVIEGRGKRNGLKVYVLVKEPWQPIEPPAEPEPDPPPPQLAVATSEAPDDPCQGSLLAGTPYDPFSEAA